MRVLKREAIRAVTTNRIAEVAGISIGSVYQHFLDKQVIFVALHQRHTDQVDRMVERKLIEHARSSLDDVMRAMINGVIAAHSTDPELYELLATEAAHRAGGTRDFAVRLHGAFRLALSSRGHELKKVRDLDSLVFIATNMVETLSRAALFRRPPHLSLAAARTEFVRAVLTVSTSASATSMTCVPV